MIEAMPRRVDRRCDEDRPDSLGIWASLRYRTAQWLLRPTALWSEIKLFARWLEFEVFPDLRQRRQTRLVLTFPESGPFDPAAARLPVPTRRPKLFAEVATFLRAVRIRRLVLDTRLESNQVSDVLILLYTARRRLGRARPEGDSVGLAGRLLSAGGIHFACTETRLADDALEVTYSYCRTKFSRIVDWFVRRYRRYHDHRALFSAAPRYAGLVVLIAMAGVMTYVFTRNWWLMVSVTVAETLTLFALVYLFFMTVGSLEYDNEEKQHRLSQAYEKVKEYAAHLRDDLRRAKAVQEQILPNLKAMPLPRRVAWASHFEPQTEVGGDYFDARPLDEDRVAIIFGDVSGHGMSAAFVTAILKTAFVRLVEERAELPSFVSRTNHHLYDSTPAESFAAVVFAIYNARTRELTYANCGHNPEPWRIPAQADGSVESLSDARSMVLGVVEEFPFASSRRVLAAGDTIFFATDGLTETRDAEGNMYGADRLRQLLADNRQASVEQLVRIVAADVAAHAGEGPQQDDRTILAMRVRPDGVDTAARGYGI